MTDVNVKINARTKGFNEAQQQTARLSKEGVRGTKEVQQEVQRLEGKLKDLSRQQMTLNRELERVGDKGSQAYKRLRQELKDVNTESTRLERVIRTTQRAYRESGQEALRAQREQARAQRETERAQREAAKHSFTQGFLQGAVPGSFIQRGPGMFRQSAGMMVGRGVRGVGEGIATSPFGGAESVAQALSSLPGGGFLAAPMMLAMQRAQAALQFRQVQHQTFPVLGGLGLEERAQAAAGRAGARASEAARKARLGTIGTPEMEKDVRVRADNLLSGLAGVETRGTGGSASPFSNPAITRAAEHARRLGELRSSETQSEARSIARDHIEAGIRRQAEADAKRERRRAAAQAASRTRKGALGDIQGMGLDFAMTAPEAVQFAAGITNAGGGSGFELKDQKMLGVSMAAQRMFGLGADVSGAFLQGGRRGGVVGGMGASGDAMVKALGEATKLGLEGSELAEFMQQMAGDIRGWRSTGIPVNTTSIAGIAGAVGRLGFGGLRGAAVAQGISARAKALSTQGPQSSADLLLMQELGGFQGGGVADFEAAQERLEGGDFGGSEVMSLFRKLFSAGGGGAGGRAVFRRALRGMGVNVGVAETKLFEKQLRGGTLDPQEQQAMNDIIKQMGGREGVGTTDEFIKRAKGTVDPVLKSQASIHNQQIATGQGMISTMQNFERSTENVAKSFERLAGNKGGLLTQFSEGVAAVSEELPKMAERARAFLRGDISGIVSGE